MQDLEVQHDIVWTLNYEVLLKRLNEFLQGNAMSLSDKIITGNGNPTFFF